jgi:hypothetical protein
VPRKTGARKKRQKEKYKADQDSGDFIFVF